MSFRYSFPLLVPSLALALVPTLSTAQCPPWICGIVQPRVQIEVSSVSPSSNLIEYSPIDVTVSATLKFVGETKPKRGKLCVLQPTPDCVPVTLHKDQTVKRTIHTRAPAAGAAVPVEVYYCEPDANGECIGKSSTASEQRLKIAARYEVILENFEILHTRAHSDDTVEVSLAGVVGTTASNESALCEIVGPPTYCIGPVLQGDFSDGVHEIRGDVRVGSFSLVPETDPDLNLLYVITNNGFGYNEKAFLAFMNLMNTFGAGIYSSLGKSGSSDLKQGTDMLNNAMVSDCDGVVMAENLTLLNTTREGQYASTLDARTRANGFWKYQSDVQEQPNRTTCGDSSKYRAALRVVRTSWQAPLGDIDRAERIALPEFSEESGPRYCPQGSAVIEVGCSGRYCDNLHLICGRYARESLFGHRDIDPHQWSGWYSEENGGHPPGWLNSAPVTGFVTGVDCRGSHCDDLRVDTDASVAPTGAGAIVGIVSEETSPARCPVGQFVTKLLCTGSYCDNIEVWCSQ